MPDNHRDKDMDVLAKRIKSEVSRGMVCEVPGSELAFIWEDDPKTVTDEEKRLAVQNFANRYQLQVVIDYGLAYAIFR